MDTTLPKGPINSNPTLFEPWEASEPYSRGQGGQCLEAHPAFPLRVMFRTSWLSSQLRARVHGFGSRRPRSLLTVLKARPSKPQPLREQATARFNVLVCQYSLILTAAVLIDNPFAGLLIYFVSLTSGFGHILRRRLVAVA
jgi:hypothetical protein